MELSRPRGLLTQQVCLILGLSLLLSACGFQLRGGGDYRPPAESVHIGSAASNGELAEELRAQFKGLDIALLDEASAQYRIAVAGEQTTRRPVASSADITVSEYELALVVMFSVLNQAGETVIAPTQIRVERIYSFDRSSLVGNTEEEALLTGEMRRDLAGQILRRFNAVLRNTSAGTKRLPPT